MKRILILVGLLVAAAGAAAGGQVGPSGRGVPTMTRNVKIFGDLENEWNDAVHRRDREAINKIVADNFELRSGANPGVPTPREESIAQALQLAPFQSSIGQMAVHEYGDLMVVSFLWKIAAAREALPKAVFVVDTWKRHEGNWQVQVRYATPVGEATGNVPGAVPPSGQSLRKAM